MNLEEVKQCIYDATKKFFEKVPVIWSEQIGPKPSLPYVTLKVGSIDRKMFPAENEYHVRYYQCSSVLEINLYTKGKKMGVEESATVNYANTALSDMSDFVNFIESDVMTDFFYCNDISLMLKPPVRDLSELSNETKYRYRAMAEFDITFTQEVDGAYGTMKMPEVTNSSGGGSEGLRIENETIENVELEEWR